MRAEQTPQTMTKKQGSRVNRTLGSSGLNWSPPKALTLLLMPRRFSERQWLEEGIDMMDGLALSAPSSAVDQYSAHVVGTCIRYQVECTAVYPPYTRLLQKISPQPNETSLNHPQYRGFKNVSCIRNAPPVPKAMMYMAIQNTAVCAPVASTSLPSGTSPGSRRVSVSSRVPRK